MLEILKRFHQITKDNIKIIDLYTEFIQSYISILQYNSINKKNQEIKSEIRPNDLLKIKEELKFIQTRIMNDEDDPLLKKADIIESVKNFNKIESLIQNLERLLNSLLLQIYLKLEIETMISQDNKNIIFELNFFQVRKKTILSFNELTIPEKVFFVIAFYISVKILLNFKNIIFSNIVLPPLYNKRGSIFRTIRKIIPVFERENNLKSFNLIFIISDFEIKEQIRNLRIINI